MNIHFQKENPDEWVMPPTTTNPEFLPSILSEIQKHPQPSFESPVKRKPKEAPKPSTDKIAVSFKNGNLTEEASEVIVNTVGEGIGPLFHSILQIGGPQILVDFKRHNKGDPVSWTRGYRLQAEYVFHARVPINKNPALSLQILKFIIKQIFELAEYW